MVDKKAKTPALVRLFRDQTFRRGVIAILAFVVLWEIGSQFKSWFGVMVPFIGKIAPPTAVAVSWMEVGQWPGYWQSWYLSTGRVFLGFTVAMIIGIPFGLEGGVMRKFKKPILAAGVGMSMLAAGAIQPAMAEVGFGKPGEAIDLVVGYQPYYTESWSGVVINGQQSWKKYLPAGSDVKFEIGLQGSVIVGKMLGEKNHLGYMGDMPAIVSTTKEDKVDIRMIAVLGTSRQQCNVFLVKNDAPLGSGQRRRHA